ncbi:MAG: 2-keto-4-pentenoate hydratase, partial [Rhodospirillales bacterium]|nr:2-keto-4-pentenoate hydratase [Rhodospirillales bacterium]
DPIDVVLWTANNLSDRGHGLAAGDLISTGSATVPTPMNIGSEAVGRFEGLGDVRASFVA